MSHLNDSPFMQQMLAYARDKKPYQGMRILHNIPLYLNTLLKIEPLVIGGADVVVTNPRICAGDAKAAQILTDQGIVVELDQLKISNDFDYVLNCCAEMIDHITPRVGAVELTQSGDQLYAQTELDYPVISADNSKTKQLETCLGTGDGLVRGLQHFIGNDFKGKSFVIFGFGKVGRGAAHGIREYSDQVTIVDHSESALNLAMRRGFEVIPAKDVAGVNQAVRKAYATVTATGKPHLINNHYNPEAFKNKCVVNLGADDEYGPAFAIDEVLNNKQAINFALSEPTAMRYIDPIFYIHNYAIDILQENSFPAGLHPYPKEIDALVLKQWEKHYNFDTTDIIF